MHLTEQLAARPDLAGEAYNLSTETQISVLDLVRTILRMMESNLAPIVEGEATHEIKHQYLDATKAREELGWQPLFDLQQGLTRTIEWYKNFLKQPARQALRVVAAPAEKAA